MSTLITIRPITIEDTDNIVRWRNSDFVKKNLYSQENLTAEQHINYFNAIVKPGKCKQFIIIENKNGTTFEIGTTFIKNIDSQSRKGEFGIFIGEKDACGKGYGKIATKLMVDYAFRELGLNRVYLSVFSDNVSAIKAYKHSGFLEEGILKQDFLRYDGYADVTLMGITRDIWKNN